MMETILNLLKSNPVFQHLGEADRAAFAALARRRDYLDGEFLCLYGDLWPYLFMVAQGLIEARKESLEGRSLLVTTLHPSDIFWGLAFFDEQLPMPVTLAARQSSRVYLWPRSHTLPFLLQHGTLAWELSRLMVRRMLVASDIVEGLAFQPVANRLARLLVEQYPADQGAATRHLTLDEMAARIGSTREMVCRILQRFANQGLIDITRTEFTFRDPAKLAQLAQKNTET